MKTYIRSHVLAVLVVGLFVGGILLSQAMGWWATESRKVARKITTGEFAGKADPADIRGSYSLQDVEKNFGIPVKVLAQAFGFEDENNPALVRARDLETRYSSTSASEPGTQGQPQPQTQPQPQAQAQPQALEIGTDSLRVFVAFYAGIPYKAKEGTGLPERAVRILKEANKLNPEQEAALEKIVVREAGALQSSAPTASSPSGIQEPHKEIAPETQKTLVSDQKKVVAPSGNGSAAGTVTSGTGSGSSSSASSESLIKGKTTFKEVLAWGITKAQIEKVLGRPMPAEGTVIKDWCTKEGLEFGTIRDALQKLKP